MSNTENLPKSPDFESIRKLNQFGIEYWSARDLMPLLGYNKWERFEGAIKRAIIACQQIGQKVEDHFPTSGKMIKAGKGATREVKDYSLSRFACYLIAQNGEPSKPEIAQAQAYFAFSTRANELHQLADEQMERLALRQELVENNKALLDAAKRAGVTSKNFGTFQEAGYKGLYGGLGTEAIKAHKGIDKSEDLLDRMGRAELAANNFRATQTEIVLSTGRVIGQTSAINTHREVSKKVRNAIEDIGGTLPEDLPTEPSIKPLVQAKKRGRKKDLPPQNS